MCKLKALSVNIIYEDSTCLSRVPANFHNFFAQFGQ